MFSLLSVVFWTAIPFRALRVLLGVQQVTLAFSLSPPATVRAASTPVRRSSRATKMLCEGGRAGVVSWRFANCSTVATNTIRETTDIFERYKWDGICVVYSYVILHLDDDVLMINGHDYFVCYLYL
jgi:hypothetical protein